MSTYLQHFITCNKKINGFPSESKTPFKSCGVHIDVVDNPEPIIYNWTKGDTIYTYWKDTDCRRQNLF